MPAKKRIMPWAKMDYEKEAANRALKYCSLGAQGLWFRMRCEMANQDKYGYLVIGKRPMTMQEIANGVCQSMDVILPLLEELEAAGVFQRLGDGTIFCEQMVRDYDAYVSGRIRGLKGGNPALTEQPTQKTGLTPSQVNLNLNPDDNPQDIHKNLKNLREEVLATLVPDEPAGMEDDDPPEAVEPPPQKPTQIELLAPPLARAETPYKRMQHECMPVLADVMGKNLDNDNHLKTVCKLLSDLYREAGKDADRVTDVCLRVPRADRADRAMAIGWIKAQLAKPGAPSLRLVANNDPDDAWGIEAMCQTRGFAPVTDPEDLADRSAGKWLFKGFFIEKVAAQVASAARLPRSWRGDWSPLVEWMDDGKIRPIEIERIVREAAQAEVYQPGSATSLRFFTSRIERAKAGMAAA